jgi:fucose permease
MRKTSSLALAVAFFGFVLVGLSGGATGVLLPSLSAFYHVDNAIIGLLFIVFSAGYFLSALNSGPLVERLNLRRFLLLATLLIAAGHFGFSLEPPYVLALAAQFLIGWGMGMLETGLNVYITAQPRHATLLNYLHAFFGVGSLLGPIGASLLLAVHWGWNSVYLFLGGLSLVLLLGFVVITAFKLPDSERGKDEEPVVGNALRVAFSQPAVWFAACFLLVYVGVEVSLGNWSYTFLLNARQQGTLAAGWIVSGYWIGLTLGRFVVQRSAERFGVSNRRLMYACTLGCAIGLLAIWLLPNGVMAAVGFLFVGFSIGPIYPLTVAVTPRLVPARLAASVIGILISLSIIGGAFFPWVAGVLLQAVGMWSLLPYALVLTALMIALWWNLTRRSAKIR